jgi:predicted DNA-binding transcriptional regulator YafY
MTEGELVAIFLAAKVMQQYRGTPYESYLTSAFEKIISALPEEVSVDPVSLAEAYSFEIGPVSQSDADTFTAVSRAATNRQRLEIVYFSQNRGEITERRIDPYHLHNYRGDWYVIAFDHRRGEVRDFHLGRIRRIRETGEAVQVSRDFDLQRYLEGGFSMERGKPVTVELEFDAYQARWIRERQKWHATEEREELPDGRLILRLKVGGLDAVKRFVLQYGGHVVVRKPARLRRMIEQEVEKLTELYSLKTTNHANERE